MSKASWETLSLRLTGQTWSRGHQPVRDPVGEVFAGHLAIPKEIGVLLERETRECLVGKQPSVSVSASRLISLKLNYFPCNHSPLF